MSVSLFTIASPLHKGLEDAGNEDFIRGIEAEMGEKFIFHGDDFSTYRTAEKPVIYVRTGGTEGVFKSFGIRDNVKLLTSGTHNSLAAAMEILSYVQRQGGTGEIVHGTPQYIKERLLGGSAASQNGGIEKFVRPLPEIDFGGAKIGVIGKPSDWLISSDVDYQKAKDKLGLELIDIDINELIGIIRSQGVDDLRSFKGSEAVYDALVLIVRKYGLQGLTVRCFDLLDTVGNTGCLALARLNSEGVPSSCEGDVPALITMMISQRLTGCPGFQCNLSRINRASGELLFAHCTVPLSMVSSYRYDTHFESGIGTAIKGELPTGTVTVAKVAPDLEHMIAIPATLVRNTSEPELCRTQIVLQETVAGSSDYFLQRPMANHHIVIPCII